MSALEQQLEHWPIDRLVEYARNPRNNDHAVDRVAAAIREFGFRVPVVAKSDGTVVDGHLVQARCDREIASMQAKAETNRVVGKRGGRPKKETHAVSKTWDSGNPQKTQTVSEKNPNVTQATSHKPITNNQHTPLVDEEGVGPDGPVCVSPSLAGRVCKAMKARGIADTSPGNPVLRELLEAGADLAEFESAAERAAQSGKGFAYALGIVVNARKQAADVAGQIHHGQLPATETPYQRSMRERMTEFAPSVARPAPGVAAAALRPVEFFESIDVPSRHLELPE